MGSRPAKSMSVLTDHGNCAYLDGHGESVDLLWCLLLELVFLCLAGVPDGGILSGQSAATWPYSSQSKHFMQGQVHVSYVPIPDTGSTCHHHLT